MGMGKGKGKGKGKKMYNIFKDVQDMILFCSTPEMTELRKKSFPASLVKAKVKFPLLYQYLIQHLFQS